MDAKESKGRSNEPIEKPPLEQQVFHQHQQQTELDEDTKYLMEFHQQIIPSQNLVNIIFAIEFDWELSHFSWIQSKNSSVRWKML